jgi:ribosomal protein S18 acetylase RimI-like enzyme
MIGDEAMITIRHYDCLPNSPGLELAVRGWSELLTCGYCDRGATVVGYDHKVIVAYNSSQESGETPPVGVLTWSELAYANEVFVMLAYVVPACRRRGVHTAMFNALVEKAQALKRPIITGSTSVHNRAAREMMKRQGREETSVNTRFRVPPL